jgi:hypothetical protein
MHGFHGSTEYSGNIYHTGNISWEGTYFRTISSHERHVLLEMKGRFH